MDRTFIFVVLASLLYSFSNFSLGLDIDTLAVHSQQLAVHGLHVRVTTVSSYRALAAPKKI